MDLQRVKTQAGWLRALPVTGDRLRFLNRVATDYERLAEEHAKLHEKHERLLEQRKDALRLMVEADKAVRALRGSLKGAK